MINNDEVNYHRSSKKKKKKKKKKRPLPPNSLDFKTVTPSILRTELRKKDPDDNIYDPIYLF